MADAATQKLIDDIVQQKVQAGESFTAYDVTIIARQRGGNVRHNDARDLVHEYYESGRMGAAYARTQIDVGAPVRPWLYHPFSVDPQSYRSPGTGGGGATSSSGTAGGAAQPPGLIKRVLNAFLGKNPGGGQNPGQGATPPGRNVPPTRPTPATPARPAPTPRPNVTLNFDAAQFLPITRDELRQEASRDRWFGNVFFGRRDLIPPVDDPRTRLIDRALVTNGLLSPEQLTEIHRVGAEMDRLRPDLSVLAHQSRAAGEAAVAAEREQKAKLKAEKKAAAAQRQSERAQQIIDRKANDIVFLGRGVSSKLHDRTSNTAALTAKQLPVLSSPADLALALGMSIPQLRWLAFHNDVATRVHYIQFQVPKKSGGTRTLSAPHRKLAAAQQWILHNILAKLPVEGAAHGFVASRSILSNATPHVGKQVLVNMDLENFFPSITLPRVRSVFVRLGYSPAVASILALLCTECPRREVLYNGAKYFVATGPRGLPQGACTSPALSNQVARRLDKRLQGLATKLDLTYTRYADDLTLSGDQSVRERVGYVLARVRHIAEDEGFVINNKKTRILRRNAAQVVTGLVVNDSPGVPRAEVRLIRAILHRAKHAGLEAQNRDRHPHFQSWLQGKIAYIAMSRPDVGAQMKAELAAIINSR